MIEEFSVDSQSGGGGRRRRRADDAEKNQPEKAREDHSRRRGRGEQRRRPPKPWTKSESIDAEAPTGENPEEEAEFSPSGEGRRSPPPAPALARRTARPRLQGFHQEISMRSSPQEELCDAEELERLRYYLDKQLQ